MSLIGSIIICYVLYKLVIRRRMSEGGKRGTGGPPVINTAPMRHRDQRPVRPMNHPAARPMRNQPPQGMPSVNSSGQYGAQPAQPAEEPEISTMDYLEEKARQDAQEHAREKWEEERRLRQNYGGHRVAERLFDGDSVPGGKKCAVCAYCGAENLIPMLPRERYSCYFCREPIN